MNLLRVGTAGGTGSLGGPGRGRDQDFIAVTAHAGDGDAEAQELAAALDELAVVHAASVHAMFTSRVPDAVRDAAADLTRREGELQAQLTLTRMLRAHLVRKLVDDRGPIPADIYDVELGMQLPVANVKRDTVDANDFIGSATVGLSVVRQA